MASFYWNHADFNFFQNVTYVGYSDKLLSSGHPHFHTKKASFKLTDRKIDVPIDQNKTYKGAATIPPLPPSVLSGCNIIDIEYNVIVSNIIDCILYTMITIPPLSPSELHGCNIIDIEYNVIVSNIIDCILYTMITIPPLPPSELHGCNIIDLQYNVIVSTVIDCILYTMITIPPLPPCELHFWKILDIQYNVFVSLCV